MAKSRFDFDVVVIGAGSAGFWAARTACDLGAKVAVVEQPGRVGGLCILRGCMPTKAMLRCSDVLHLIHRAPEFGIRTGKVAVHLGEIIERQNRFVKEFADFRHDQIKKAQFEFLRGKASFLDKYTLKIGSKPKPIRAKSFIIATGSVVATPAIPGLDTVGALNSDDLLELRKLPKSMIILGGGPVALEFAQFYQRLGSRVTLIQRGAHVLSREDSDMAIVIEEQFRKDGMTVYTNTHSLKLYKAGKQKAAEFRCGTEIIEVQAEVLVNALGRRPNIDGLNLEAAGVQVHANQIVVNDCMQTNCPNIYAAGDVIGHLEVVHIAIQQGLVAGHNAVRSGERQIDYRLKAFVVFTDPGYASVGLNETEAKIKDIPYLVSTYPFNDHGKSIVMGETQGFIKMLADPDTGEIIGGQIVGPEAGELIHEWIVAMHFRSTVFDFMNIPHYHPTLAEMLTYPAEELAEKIRINRRKKFRRKRIQKG